MNKLVLILGISLFFISCGSNHAGEPVPEEDTAVTADAEFMWQAVLNDSTGKMEMTQVLIQGADNTSPQHIVESENKLYPEIHLDYLKNSGDTIFLKIDDATYLTQQMGTYGAASYIAGVVYNLTETAGTRYVHLAFEEGDHAQPGTFTREYFENE